MSQTAASPPDPAPPNGIPFFQESVAAGFPSPAEGELRSVLNLNDLCVTNPTATYFVRARGESMINAGICDGDILVVDRSIKPGNGSIIIASISGEFTVKELDLRGPVPQLLPANPAYAPIIVTPELGAELFGVVTYVVHKMHR